MLKVKEVSWRFMKYHARLILYIIMHHHAKFIKVHQISMVVYENSMIDMKWQHPLLSVRKARRKAGRTCPFIECMFECREGSKKNRNKFVTRIQHGTPWGLWNASTRIVNIDLTSNLCSNLDFMEWFTRWKNLVFRECVGRVHVSPCSSRCDRFAPHRGFMEKYPHKHSINDHKFIS